MWSGKTELDRLDLGSEFVLFPMSVPSNEAVSHNTNNTVWEESRIAWVGLPSLHGDSWQFLPNRSSTRGCSGRAKLRMMGGSNRANSSNV